MPTCYRQPTTHHSLLTTHHSPRTTHNPPQILLNIPTLRWANSVFEPLWSREHIETVQITFKEDLGTQVPTALLQHSALSLGLSLTRTRTRTLTLTTGPNPDPGPNPDHKP